MPLAGSCVGRFAVRRALHTRCTHHRRQRHLAANTARRHTPPGGGGSRSEAAPAYLRPVESRVRWRLAVGWHTGVRWLGHVTRGENSLPGPRPFQPLDAIHRAGPLPDRAPRRWPRQAPRCGTPAMPGGFVERAPRPRAACPGRGDLRARIANPRCALVAARPCPGPRGRVPTVSAARPAPRYAPSGGFPRAPARRKPRASCPRARCPSPPAAR